MYKKVKLFFIVVLSLILCITGVQVVFSDNDTMDTIEPELYVFNDSPAIMYNGFCLVPIRKLCEYIGAELEWVQESKMIIVTHKGTKMKMQQNNKYMTSAPIGASYSNPQIMDTPVITYGGKSYVNAKFMALSLMATADWDDQYLQINTYNNEYLTGTPTKSALFPILTSPDISQLPKLPKAKIINENSIPQEDVTTLKSKLPDVFKQLYFDSDIAVSLINRTSNKYLQVYVPLIPSYCQNINYQNDPGNEEYYYRVRAKQMAIIMKGIGDTIYRNYRDEMNIGLWEKYNSGMKVTMLNARKESLSIYIPFKALKVVDNKLYLPIMDSRGTYYLTYINEKLLGERDVEGWTESYDNKLIQFFNAPVTKPLSPYYEVVDISIPF